MNKVFLQGNVTRDGQVVEFQNGGAVTKFGIATNRSYQKDGEWKEVVNFVDCELFRKVEVKKGDPILVEGELETQSWEKDGEKRSKLVVRVNTIKKFAKIVKANETTQAAPEGELVGAGSGSDGGASVGF